jgi:hypothetical protein
MSEEKANRVLEQARAIAETAPSWAKFSAAVFDQQGGIIAQSFSPGMERQSFYDSEQYKQIQAILISLMKRFGVVDGSRVDDQGGPSVASVPVTVPQKLDIGSTPGYREVLP